LVVPDETGLAPKFSPHSSPTLRLNCDRAAIYFFVHTMEVICDAIRNKRLIEFHYEGHLRIVEPQILGKNKTGNMILSAWQVGGHTESGSRLPWRDYQIVKFSKLKVLEEKFDGPRPGYVKGGGKKFMRVFCELAEDLRKH
jgi:hypothetical protein